VEPPVSTIDGRTVACLRADEVDATLELRAAPDLPSEPLGAGLSVVPAAAAEGGHGDR
jgi:hypothetical protein